MKALEDFRITKNSKQIYKTVNNDRRNFKPTTTMCRNKEGIILTKKDEVLKRWTEFFKELLGKQNSDTPEQIE